MLARFVGLITTGYIAMVANRARELDVSQRQLAQEARNEAEHAKQMAQRSAIIAGASPLLPDDTERQFDNRPDAKPPGTRR